MPQDDTTAVNRDDEDDLERPEDQLYPDGGNIEGEDNIDALPEDNDTPASAPSDPISDATEALDARPDSGRLNPEHPATDTNLQQGEEYDEGLSGAAEASEPNPGNNVVGYDPAHDHRLHPDLDAAEDTDQPQAA